MKGGCIVSIAGGLGMVGLGFVAFFLFNLGWFEEKFGQMGMAFAVGGVAVMLIVFFAIALVGAIFFGLSGLWVTANGNSGNMMGIFAESMATSVKAIRTPAGNGGQAQNKPPTEPVFPPQIEYGGRPGQYALGEGQPPYAEERGGGVRSLGGPASGGWGDVEKRYGEVIAR